MKNKIRCITGVAFFLLASMLCSQAHATHIQYVDLAADLGDENVSPWVIGSSDTMTCTFDLIKDTMYLWEIDTPTTHTGVPTPNVNEPDRMGPYDTKYTLHYVTLRIDPNNYTNNPTSNYIDLEVNGNPIDFWSNPIRLYDWGVPYGSVYDPYLIADPTNNYEIRVTLTGLESLGYNTITIDVNLEGCFGDAHPCPEPATMLLLGSGLIGLAGLRKKLKK